MSTCLSAHELFARFADAEATHTPPPPTPRSAAYRGGVDKTVDEIAQWESLFEGVNKSLA
jgi:hypothetical protein